MLESPARSARPAHCPLAASPRERRLCTALPPHAPLPPVYPWRWPRALCGCMHAAVPPAALPRLGVHTFEVQSWTEESLAPCSCSRVSTRAPADLTRAHSSARMGVWSQDRSLAASRWPFRSASTALESPTFATNSCVPLTSAMMAVVPDILSSISDMWSSSLVCMHTLRADTSGDGLKLGSSVKFLDICKVWACDARQTVAMPTGCQHNCEHGIQMATAQNMPRTFKAAKAAHCDPLSPWPSKTPNSACSALPPYGTWTHQRSWFSLVGASGYCPRWLTQPYRKQKCEDGSVCHLAEVSDGTTLSIDLFSDLCKISETDAYAS